MRPETIIIIWVAIVTTVPPMFGLLYFWWIDISDYRRALATAWAYKTSLEDDCLKLWKDYNFNPTSARQSLEHLEKAEDITTKEQTWALIPYLERLRAQLTR